MKTVVCVGVGDDVEEKGATGTTECPDEVNPNKLRSKSSRYLETCYFLTQTSFDHSFTEKS